MCTNKVSQFVPKGYGYMEIKSPCGSTSIHGEVLICDECEAKFQKLYPQGWRDVPGDICKHGTYIGYANGVDYLCPKCENGV